MAEHKVGRYRVVGSNGHYLVGRWDGEEYRVMHSVPSYGTMAGAVKKAKSLDAQDKRDGINVKVPK